MLEKIVTYAVVMYPFVLARRFHTFELLRTCSFHMVTHDEMNDDYTQVSNAVSVRMGDRPGCVLPDLTTVCIESKGTQLIAKRWLFRSSKGMPA